MNILGKKAGAILLGLAVASPALAQYTGPGAPKTASPMAHTVAEVLKNPVDDQPVHLTGLIVKQTGKETYLFRDDTGEIQVEIDAKDFPAGKPVAATTRVMISGEVDKDAAHPPEIDVEKVTLAQ